MLLLMVVAVVEVVITVVALCGLWVGCLTSQQQASGSKGEG